MPVAIPGVYFSKHFGQHVLPNSIAVRVLLNKLEPCGTCELLELTPLKSNFCRRRRRVEPLLQVLTTGTNRQPNIPIHYPGNSWLVKPIRQGAQVSPFLSYLRTIRKEERRAHARGGSQEKKNTDMLEATNKGAVIHLSNIENSNSSQV